MATCKSIHHIFTTQQPNNPNPSPSSSFLDSLSSSWPHLKPPPPPPPPHSFTELFGELHFHDHPLSPISDNHHHHRTGSFSSMNHESLHRCTEGLGFESLDNVDDLKINDTYKLTVTNHTAIRGSLTGKNRGGRHNREFPPPISCISGRGRGWISFESYRENGRFILKEVRVPETEVLRACRKDGRLRLKFVEYSDQESDFDDDDGDETEDDDGEGEDNE